jgi:hypothetical protein
MLRRMTRLAVALALLTGAGLYWVRSDTRRLEARAQSLERRIEKAETATRGAEAKLNRAISPDRLEPLSRHELGLEPANPRQIVRAEDLTRSRLKDAKAARKP